MRGNDGRSNFVNDNTSEFPTCATPVSLQSHSRVLHGGHAVYILVERVAKPTDNRSAGSLCNGVTDAPSRVSDRSYRRPRRISLYPSPRRGRGYLDESF